MTDKKSTKDLYDKIASTWTEKSWVKSEEFAQELRIFAGVNNEQALDVGIGSGDTASTLGLKKVVGVDISESMLQECRKQYPRFMLILGDAEVLPFPDNTFELVYCRNLLQHFNDPTNAFHEMYRVTQWNGKIMCFESAVYDGEREYPTATVRVVEPWHPLFPSHEQLDGLFVQEGVKNIVQKVASCHKRWLSSWAKAKQATSEQKSQMMMAAQQWPNWYKEKYRVKIYRDEEEIESTMTFSWIKGMK